MEAMVPPLPTGELKTAEVEADGSPSLQLDSKDQLCPAPVHVVVGEDGVCARAGSAEAAIVKYGNIFILCFLLYFLNLRHFPNNYNIHIKKFF